MSLTFDEKIFDDIEEKRKEWQKEVDAAFEARPERLERFSTVSDLGINRIYTPEDVKEQDFIRDISF